MRNLFAKSQKTVFLEFRSKSVKPLSSDKTTAKEIINVTKNGGILSLSTDIADTFNDYFSSVAQNLNISRENSMLSMDLSINPVLTEFEKYKHHQSISINKKLREKGHPKFSFHFVTLNCPVVREWL